MNFISRKDLISSGLTAGAFTHCAILMVLEIIVRFRKISITFSFIFEPYILYRYIKPCILIRHKSRRETVRKHKKLMGGQRKETLGKKSAQCHTKDHMNKVKVGKVILFEETVCQNTQQPNKHTWPRCFFVFYP